MIASWVMVLFLYKSGAVTIPNFSSEQACIEELNRITKNAVSVSLGQCVKVH